MVTNSGFVGVALRFAILFYFLLLLSGVSNAQATITTQPMDATVCLTQSTTASFTCVVEDTGNLGLATAGWQICVNGVYVSIPLTGRDRHMTNASEEGNIITDTLIVTDVSVNDSGAEYRCRPIDNEISDVVTIIVLAIPPVITGIEVTEVCTNDFNISWTAAGDEEELSYNVTLLSPSMMNGRVTDAMMDASYNFTDLMPNTAYNVSVASRLNDTCVGIATTIMVTTVTVEAGVPQRVSNLTSTTTDNATGIMITWDPANSTSDCGPVFYYILTVTSLADGSKWSIVVWATNTVFFNLTNGINYTISVAAVNRAGAGPSETINVTGNAIVTTSSMPPVTTTPAAPGNPGNNGPNNGEPNNGGPDDGPDPGLIAGICIGLLFLLILVIVICIGIYYLYYKKKKGAVTEGDRQELKSPTTSTMEGHKPSNVNVPHQTADSGVEYAVTTKAVGKPQQQQQQPPAQEYAMVDKSKKKNSAANQGVMYADLQQLPSSGNAPPQNQGPTATYAQVA